MQRLLDVLTDEEKRLKKEVFDLTMKKQRLERQIQALRMTKEEIRTGTSQWIMTNTTDTSYFLKG